MARLVAAEQRRSEADIQASVRDLLLHGGLDLADAHVRLEAPAHNRRRIDVEVGATVIEVKRDLTRGLDAAQRQLADYLAGRQAEYGGRYSGILTDGLRWQAYRLTEQDELREVVSYDLSATDPDVEALLIWLDGILATQQAISPTPRDVALRLGADSSATRLDLAELGLVYEQCAEDPSVQTKRQLWSRLLTTAFGTSFNADDTQLFLEHTYLVVLAKMVAHAAVEFDLTASSIEADELLAGRFFIEQGILGVVEADFFDWPTDTTAGRVWVHNLARRVARFRWDRVEHDVLKVLYESVIGRETRHALGEYYTPDWLAKALVDAVVDDPLRQRVLDPGCGSGTFVFWAVQQCLTACETAGLTTAEAITSVTSRVFGIDIHPVAVALARVTYLLAITPARLRLQRPRFAVPVWLGDSVQYQRSDTLHDVDALTIHATDGAQLFASELRFPERVVDDIRWFDSLVGEMTDRATNRRPRDPVPNLKATYERHGVHPDDQSVLDATMTTLCELSDEGRDHIWGYYVRNEARPRWLSRPENRVDRLVGNPPWLSYRYMTTKMQERFRELSAERGLWQGKTVATHQDLSTLFVARTVEQYLQPEGRFGYLMPLAVLTRQAYVGFRTGRWSSPKDHRAESTAATAAFDVPWDLHDILPRIFPVPPAAVLGTRTRESPRPLQGKATKWSGRQPPGLDPSTSLTVEDVPLVQMPTTADEWSPYKARFYQGATIVPRSLTMVEHADPGPLGTAAGTVAVKAQRSPREKQPWKDLPTMRGVIEERFVFNVHLGPEVFAFRTLDPQLAVLPWTGERVLTPDDSELDRWPGFAAWWRQANERWLEHRSKKNALTLDGRLDYHRGLSVQGPALNDLRVVYSASGQYPVAAIVDQPRTFIEHKLYWCRVRNLDEGCYLTAVLNAPVILERVAPLQSRGEHNPRDIDKYVWALPIPRFDATDEVHRKLVDLAGEAEDVAAAVELADTRFESGRRRIREALVGSGVARRLDEAVDALLLRGLAAT